MSDEHSKDKRQMAAWVERQLAEKVDQVASKRGITRTAAIVEALQRYVEEETSTAQQLQSLDEKLSNLLENGALSSSTKEANAADQDQAPQTEMISSILEKMDEIIEQNEEIKAELGSIKTGKARRPAQKKKAVQQETMSLF